eukprot:gene7220-biopygen14058
MGGEERVQGAREGLEKLRGVLFQRGTHGIFGLARFFRIADADHSGHLDHDEFQVWLFPQGVTHVRRRSFGLLLSGIFRVIWG